jgi:hypothetical protein
MAAGAAGRLAWEGQTVSSFGVVAAVGELLGFDETVMANAMGAAYAHCSGDILFTIFVFGPCEPLIPLPMYPATALSSWAVVLVAVVFGVVTIATMTGVIYLSSLGLGFISPERLGRFSHSLASGTIFLCGIAIRLGL